MEIEVYLPEFPVEEDDKSCPAVLLFWYKAEGETVEEGESLCEVETTKATFVLPAPVSGTLTKILVQPGEPVSSGQQVGIISSL